MTPEQSALLSKAYDSVRAAKLLSDAELYDFAVSRAYYAMFYMAEAFLLGVGLSFSRHAGVIAAFGERFAKTGIVPVEFHRYLIEGQDKRLAQRLLDAPPPATPGNTEDQDHPLYPSQKPKNDRAHRPGLMIKEVREQKSYV
jgi:uncharacterized protein (UPF0332 family)